MFTVIAGVAVIAISYWTDRLSDKEAIQRAVVFDDDIVRQSVVFARVLDASRSRPDVFSKLYCGYSTPARSGTCCRKAIRTTNPFIGAFKPGAAMKFCGEC